MNTSGDHRLRKLARREFVVAQERVYLNTGSVGPMSKVLFEGMAHFNRQEHLQGRVGLDHTVHYLEAKQRLRAVYARLLGADPDEIALTQNTTVGMNSVAHGLNWQPGDEVVTTSLEHEGGLLPAYVLHRRYEIGLHVVELDHDDDPVTMLAKIEAAMSRRTRLLIFSHVAWNTGAVLPMDEIVELAHRYGALALVDAAQSAGAIAVDVHASGVDGYAVAGQKWLCGPEGTGALYVRRDRLDDIAPTYAGYYTVGDPSNYDMDGQFTAVSGAARYEISSVHKPSLMAQDAHLCWLESRFGWPWIYHRIAELYRYAYERLSALDGATVLSPAPPQAGLLTFVLPSYDPARVTAYLEANDIIIRYLPRPYSLRVSTGFYNDEDDIDRLVETLAEVLAMDPDQLPEFVPPAERVRPQP
ncbi:MAG: aminotransferase class V-fold PLP-dependent enzyme [Candidatus Promineifilaceae bacterium]|nr:aminotransferase class V-fold PLP-dependent enzyme [Candidatus Promineifilaceae bacterium]